MAERLSKAQCILLAVHFASEVKIQELHALYGLRSQDALPAELVLRILLTYLPEVTPPAQYTALVSALVSEQLEDGSTLHSFDLTHIDDVSEATADKRLRKLSLLPLSPPSYPPEGPDDLLPRFICHRTYLIDQQSGLVSLIPDLVTPFLDKSAYLRLWYISTVLPLSRLRGDFYPGLDLAPELTIEAFDKIDGYHGTDLLLSGARATDHEIVSLDELTGTIGRDLRGLVGPWVYGHTARKRRKLGDLKQAQEHGTREGGEDADTVGHDWEHVFTWLAKQGASDFATAAAAIEQWDGPVDADLKDLVSKTDVYSKEEFLALQLRYAQCGIAICYAFQDNTADAIIGAHAILGRLAVLLHFIPPPDLATSVDQLPKVDDHISDIRETNDESELDVGNLMQEDHSLTRPTLAAYMFLQMLVYSAYQLAGLGHRISIVNVAKMRMFSTAEEQLALLQRLLHGLTQNGKKDQHQWLADLGRIIWLWGWNIEDYGDGESGAGALGKIKRADLDRELLIALLATGNYGLVDRLFIRREDKRHKLSDAAMEEAILAEAMRCYDNASNGNRTRGSMQKCHEILSAFRMGYPTSKGFDRAVALVSATHSMSYYSLTLQHRIPLKPVNIRAAHDPLSLIEKILEQNPKSYTKLDDLISIGRNLAIASPSAIRESASDSTPDEPDLLIYAERRVIFLCISAALSAQDFDTAYSYLMNRLSPSSALSLDTPRPEADDISWRAAFLAGRYRPASSAPQPTASLLRRLEQRTELLSLALLLAPPSALTEILSVYRRTEEEVSALMAQDAEADDAADRGQHAPSSAVPGSFDALGPDGGIVYGQKTRESVRRPEAPVGLFDLAQGAAKALTKNAFPLRSASGRTLPPEQEEEAWGWNEEEGEQQPRHSGERVRKRDMVASAVTGSLASGIGWVLGATPVEKGAQ